MGSTTRRASPRVVVTPSKAHLLAGLTQAHEAQHALFCIDREGRPANPGARRYATRL